MEKKVHELQAQGFTVTRQKWNSDMKSCPKDGHNFYIRSNEGTVFVAYWREGKMLVYDHAFAVNKLWAVQWREM